MGSDGEVHVYTTSSLLADFIIVAWILCYVGEGFWEIKQGCLGDVT